MTPCPRRDWRSKGFLTGTGDPRNGGVEIGAEKDPRNCDGDVTLTMQANRPRLKVLLASPRGFCAGVSRAIQTVEEALAQYGAPVYVRHEIVHNAHVVKRLETMGAVFVEEVKEAPDDRPLIFSAHGAPAAAYEAARIRGVTLIDAACPLVLKVHSQVKRFIGQGRHVIVIGHDGHPEVVGVVGQSAAKNFSLVETIDDAQKIAPPDQPLAYVTQTTLSVDDTSAIIEVLRTRFPEIAGPRKADICYATSNRQTAVKEISKSANMVFVLGSPDSSNSQRLVDVARKCGVENAVLVNDPATISLDLVKKGAVVGVTAGASAPEDLVEALLTRLAAIYTLVIETVETAREDIAFKMPQKLQQAS